MTDPPISDFGLRPGEAIGPTPRRVFGFIEREVEATRKPNSVPESGLPEAGNDHSSMDAGHPTPRATYPEARTGRPLTLPYLVLHRVGFAELPRSPGELVRSYRTISPLPDNAPVGPRRAVYFLLHFPSCRHDFTL